MAQARRGRFYGWRVRKSAFPKGAIKDDGLPYYFVPPDDETTTYQNEEKSSTNGAQLRTRLKQRRIRESCLSGEG
jgi:hypothetical protein